jgi:hypothetical protein
MQFLGVGKRGKLVVSGVGEASETLNAVPKLRERSALRKDLRKIKYSSVKDPTSNCDLWGTRLNFYFESMISVFEAPQSRSKSRSVGKDDT